MAFNLSEYDPVENRVHAFWQDHDKGRIHTEIVLINETEIVIKASVFADREDPRPVAIGFAQESRKTDPVSFAEKCETSAIGRALANLGYSPNLKNKFLRASREEMEKVQRGENKPPRDWAKELKTLSEAKDIQGLRELRKDAVRAVRPDVYIQAIDDAGKAITDTP
jgi:hypothetical protein